MSEEKPKMKRIIFSTFSLLFCIFSINSLVSAQLFYPEIVLPTSQAPYNVTVGDLNSDGHPDLAVTTGDSYFNGYFEIYLGSGNGRFQKGSTLQLPEGLIPNQTALVDINGDGDLDLVMMMTV